MRCPSFIKMANMLLKPLHRKPVWVRATGCCLAKDISSFTKSLNLKLEGYMRAKSRYDALLSRYDIFKAKEKSTEYAAEIVGLKLPKSPR